jgi:hypothetical protein
MYIHYGYKKSNKKIYFFLDSQVLMKHKTLSFTLLHVSLCNIWKHLRCYLILMTGHVSLEVM